MAEAPITLSSGNLELTIDAATGGAISGLHYRDSQGGRVPVLRESPSPLRSVLDAACFPLVPFSNRIRGGCFTFRDRQVRLSPNMKGDPSPLHGQGWTSAWTVEQSGGAEAVLAFSHDPGEWPWAYEARQHFRLAPDALRVRISCRNRSDEQMPCGLGLHPYFNCGPDTRIQTKVDEVWTVDETTLPVARMPATGRYAIADDPVCSRDLDNGYGGWSGRAILSDPGWPFELELSSRDARFFQLYSPVGQGFFVAEPVSHANAALNEPEQDWPSLGIQLLGPEQEMDVEMRLEVQPR